MLLTFKTKAYPTVPDTACIELASFLLNVREFLDLTFSLLSRKKSPERNSEFLFKRILSLYQGKCLKDNVNISSYLELIFKYYNTSQDCLNSRRGCLLELIVKEIKPLILVDNYDIIPESIVYYCGAEMSKKDIDIVFLYSGIELIECKSSAKNYLRPEPLEKDKIEKLKLMEDTQNLAIKENYDCIIFLATYDEETS